MSKKTISVNQLLSVALFVLSVIIYLVFFPMSNNGLLCNVQFVSITGILFYLFIFFSWKSIYFRILSPYFVFVTTLYLCLCGQSIMWAFGLNAGYRDLQTWSSLFDNYDICRGLLFTYCCLLFLHCVVILRVKNKKTINNSAKKEKISFKNEEIVYKIMLFMGIITCSIFIFPYLISSIKTYSIISSMGYSAQYDQGVYGLNSITNKLGEFFPVGVLTLFYALGQKTQYNKKNYIIKAFFAYSLVLIYLVCELLVSQRTGVVLFSIAFLFIVFRNKKISKKQIIIGIMLAIILMASMRMIDLIRSNKIMHFSDFTSMFIDYKSNPVIDFLGDIGWNLMTLMEFQKLMPDVRDFAYGLSYIASLTSIIPNINLWAVHPATLYGEISGWLRIYLGYNFGLGCTPIAESYYNFASFGFLVFYFWGKLLIYLNKKFEENTLLSNYLVVLFIGILLKSCVRSSFVAVFRPMLLYVLLPVLIIKIIFKKYKV